MIFPGYEAIMLALEANGVIGLRLMKIAHGGVEAGQEVILMVLEKVDAAAEAQATLMGGGNVEAVIMDYRQLVALNAQRLSPQSTFEPSDQFARLVGQPDSAEKAVPPELRGA